MNLAWIPAVLAAVAAGGLIALDNRRASTLALGVQYACCAWLIGTTLPPLIGAAKGAAGVLACVILALTLASPRPQHRIAPAGALPSGRAFRVVAVLLVAAVSAGLAPQLLPSLPGVPAPLAWGSVLLVGMGFLQLGIVADPLRLGIGLLTLVNGFELSYSVLEPSLAVTALLAAIHLGIALVVSFLLSVEPTADAEPEGG